MAIPTYVGKLVKDQIVEALPLADIVKLPVAQRWTATQSFPSDNANAGLPTADKIVNNYVSSILLQDGVIHMTFGNKANGILKEKILTMRPAVVADAAVVPVVWVCGFAKAPGNMTVKGTNKTNIDVRYLPSQCR